MIRTIIAMLFVLILSVGCSSQISHTSTVRVESYASTRDTYDPCMGRDRIHGLRSHGVIVNGVRWYCN